LSWLLPGWQASGCEVDGMEGELPDYDSLAWIYNRTVADSYAGQMLPVLQQLLLRHLAPGAHLLDLCCGCGQVAQLLLDQGFQVTGVDISPGMIGFARKNAPRARYVIADARQLAIRAGFQGLISTFNSLNHIMTRDELTMVLGQAADALAPGGHLLVDLTVSEGYHSPPANLRAVVEDDLVYIMRYEYDSEARICTCHFTTFSKGRGREWYRDDLTHLRKIYSTGEVCAALRAAGLVAVEVHDTSSIGETDMPGQACFLARKPDEPVLL
jgi:SAM-dependent methyltransferase